MRQEDHELYEEREQRCRALTRGIELLEHRAHALVIEANELRKMLAKLRDIQAATKADPLRGEAAIAAK